MVQVSPFGVRLVNAEVSTPFPGQLRISTAVLTPHLGYSALRLSVPKEATAPEDGILNVFLEQVVDGEPSLPLARCHNLARELARPTWYTGVRLHDFGGHLVHTLREPTLEQERLGEAPFTPRGAAILGDILVLWVSYRLPPGGPFPSFQVNWDGTVFDRPLGVRFDVSCKGSSPELGVEHEELIQLDLSRLPTLPDFGTYLHLSPAFPTRRPLRYFGNDVARGE